MLVQKTVVGGLGKVCLVRVDVGEVEAALLDDDQVVRQARDVPNHGEKDLSIARVVQDDRQYHHHRRRRRRGRRHLVAIRPPALSAIGGMPMLHEPWPRFAPSGLQSVGRHVVYPSFGVGRRLVRSCFPGSSLRQDLVVASDPPLWELHELSRLAVKV